MTVSKVSRAPNLNLRYALGSKSIVRDLNVNIHKVVFIENIWNLLFLGPQVGMLNPFGGQYRLSLPAFIFCFYISVFFFNFSSVSSHILILNKNRIRFLWRRCMSQFDGLVWFVGFYGISTFVGCLTPNPFLCKESVLFKTIQFSISTQFNFQKHFYFKLFKQLYITIQFSVSTVSVSKIVQFQTIQFSKSTQFKCKYILIVKNISISSYSV